VDESISDHTAPRPGNAMIRSPTCITSSTCHTAVGPQSPSTCSGRGGGGTRRSGMFYASKTNYQNVSNVLLPIKPAVSDNNEVNTAPSPARGCVRSVDVKI